MMTTDCAHGAGQQDDKIKQTWGVAIRYIIGRKRAEEALGLLSAAGSALNSIPDLEAATQAVASYIVPYLADWCRIDLFDQEGATKKLAGAQTPKVTAAVASAIDDFIDRPDRLHSSRIRRVWESRKPMVYPEESNGPNASSGTNGTAHAAAPAPSKIGTAIIVPIEAGGRLLGAVSCATVRIRSTGPYGDGDLALVAEIAGRIATALVIAELTRTVARQRTDIARLTADLSEPSRKGMG